MILLVNIGCPNRKTVFANTPGGTRYGATSLRSFLSQLVAAAQHRVVAAMLRRRAGKRLATDQRLELKYEAEI